LAASFPVFLNRRSTFRTS